MKTPVSELKRRSKSVLSGNYNLAVCCMLIMGIVLIVIYIFLITALFLMGMIFFAAPEGPPVYRKFSVMISFMVLLFITVVQFSLTAVLLNFGSLRLLLNLGTGQPASMKDLIFAFSHKPYRFLGLFAIFYSAGLAMGIPYYVVSIVSYVTHRIAVMVMLQVLMYLLLLIGTCVFCLNFNLAGILLAEQPERTVIGCFRESRQLMRGNKGRMFYMWLSFLGMILLCMGSWGLGFLWVIPFMTETHVQFYLDLKAGMVLSDINVQKSELAY